MGTIKEHDLRLVIREQIDAVVAEMQLHEAKDAEAEAKKRLSTIEKEYGKKWESKLKAFKWADDPDAALADLYRKAGKEPSKG